MNGIRWIGWESCLYAECFGSQSRCSNIVGEFHPARWLNRVLRPLQAQIAYAHPESTLTVDLIPGGNL